jgi:membrane protease YdiL (CAAX protease family)
MLDSNSLSDDLNLMPAVAPAVHTRSRASQGLELGVFLMLIVPGTIFSFFVAPLWMHQGFTATSIASIIRQASLVTLIWYFLHQNGESLRRLGWSFRLWPLRVVIGVVTLPLALNVVFFASRSFIQMGLSSLKGPVPEGLGVRSLSQIPLALVLITVIAVGEETVFRGYLILRLKEVTGSLPVAVFLSTLLFALAHNHLGTAGMGVVAIMGLIFAGLYLLTGSLLAPIVLHFLYDIYWMVSVPLTQTH